MSSLVIVESPAKAKTLSRILGSGYAVEASYGHIRDLPESADQIPARVKNEPWARLGVDVEAGFEPLYVIPKDKKKHIRRLREALAKADELLLATDEDREGESISWHVVEVLQPEVPVRRIAFHEITDEAIHAALENPREIDENLVRAQESRRILDRLYGYELSPVLWKKVRTGLSAGRVQSVAVRLCVLRERERWRFRKAAYWDVEAAFRQAGESFTASLVRLGGRRLASGQDFDAGTGELQKGSDALWLRSEEEAVEALEAWSRPWTVSSVSVTPQSRRPAPPFTTSSLQQEANRKLRFTAQQTMRVAQRLYEGIDLGGDRVGLITYMRTDSVTLSDKALRDAGRLVKERYGDRYHKGPRRYVTRAKGAQEAHEAIRPTEISRTPDQMRRFLRDDELRLYELIWKRLVASQMTDAELLRTSVEITAPAEDGKEGIFSVSGKRVKFPGFLRVYEEGRDNQGLREREVVLPPLEEGQSLEPRRVEPRGHETSPPPRYTEATLVKKLEAEGIGRPSTYAPILETIQDRGYVFKQRNALVPTFTAFAVTKLLEDHFFDYVDTEFTARMEQQLDDVAGGELGWQEQLEEFYFSQDPAHPGLERRLASEEEIDYPVIELGSHPGTGNLVVVKVGRFGPYVQTEDEEGERIAASIPQGQPPADFSLDLALRLLEQAREGGRSLGRHPQSNEEVLLLHGRFGPYVQLGPTLEDKGAPKPRRASLPRGVEEEDVTLEDAVKWLSLPRVLGTDPESDEEVVATQGRFGPYVKRGKETRSLGSGDDVYGIGLERALELLAQPKGGRRRKPKVLKELTPGEGGTIRLLDGRYGPYLTDGKLNASLPKGADPEDLTPEDAARILKEKGKPPRRRRRKG